MISVDYHCVCDKKNCKHKYNYLTNRNINMIILYRNQTTHLFSFFFVYYMIYNIILLSTHIKILNRRERKMNYIQLVNCWLLVLE